MITRFRLEVAGTSHRDCRKQLEVAWNEIFGLDGSERSDWEITDDVGWFSREDNVYVARIVMKRRVEDAVVA